MSFDLLVFDLQRAPSGDEDFRTWYEARIQWDQSFDYNDPDTSAPALQNFYRELSKSFPPSDRSAVKASRPIAEPGFLDKLARRFLNRTQHSAIESDVPEDFDEACFTDYTFCEDAIYMGFS